MTKERLARAHESLQGLSVGDAFGECFFIAPQVVEQMIQQRAFPAAPWRFTDDTMMALSIVNILARYREIRQDELIRDFALHYHAGRGYGPAMHELLPRIREGASWQEETGNLFKGQGSFGNGAAMRVAPLGAYFADDLETVILQARRSAEVTHAHPEGIAGAIAVAVAAAWAYHLRGTSPLPSMQEFLNLILPHVPSGEVQRRITQAMELGPEADVQEAGTLLGTGSRVSAQDTVPFTLWCAGKYLNNYEEAMWLTVSGLGDRDTTCAIVGGIVAAHTGAAGIPAEWLQARESLPDWYHMASTG